MAQTVASAADPAPLNYPATRRDPTAEVLFGTRVADPYRWLENDLRSDPAVADWIARENALTARVLADLPLRDRFAARIRTLTDYDRFGLPKKAAGRYFYLRNTGLLNQAQLWMRQGLEGRPRLLIDPNTWSADGATALDPELWEPSRNGRLLAYGVQDGGSDWRTIRVVDTVRGRLLADTVRWAKYTRIAWVGSQGFLYSRFAEPVAGAEFQQPTHGQEIWFHRVGTAQAEDMPVYATPDRPALNHSAQVTSDGRVAVITSSVSTDARHEIHIVRLPRAGVPGAWQVEPLVTGFDHDWELVDKLGVSLVFVTDKEAPRRRVVRFDLTPGGAAALQTVVPEGEAPMDRARIVGDQLIVTYLRDAASVAVLYTINGDPRRPPSELVLNGLGTAAGFAGRPGDPETFFSFSSFTRPQTIYRYDVSTGQSSVFAEPKLGFDPDDFVTEQVFFASKDGTRVPMFVVRRKADAAQHRAVPTLLYGYGGFDVSLTPGFAASRMAWLEAGGAFALANVRGGGEYGREWHEGGRGANKQNAFDDFIAAGETLIAQGITPRGGLAIQGGSNGGLLVGAVVNQRPDLFAAANPQVGVMDMLRFDRFTAGRYWKDDYGDPAKEADFRRLLAYSPYHNVKDGADYPAILVTTADTDDRVVPAHSFKYAAALQAAHIGPKPHLIRIETRAGHGAGKPTDKAIAESADVLAFLARWTGLGPAAR